MFSAIRLLISKGVVEASGMPRVMHISFFEKGADDLWGPAQTLFVNSTVDDYQVGISASAAVLTGFVSDVPGRFVNVTATGSIIGCNAPEPTTPSPSYSYSYSRHFRRYRRCPKWCAAPHLRRFTRRMFFWRRCGRCKA